MLIQLNQMFKTLSQQAFSGSPIFQLMAKGFSLVFLSHHPNFPSSDKAHDTKLFRVITTDIVVKAHCDCPTLVSSSHTHKVLSLRQGVCFT